MLINSLVVAGCAATVAAIAWDEVTPTMPVTTHVTLFTDLPTPATQCPDAHLQCCQSIQLASDRATAVLLSLLGVILPPESADALIGVSCVSGSQCSADKLVCCQVNGFRGGVSVGCVAIVSGLG